MTTTIILILIYVALVFIGYGMLVQSDKDKNNFMCAALIVWATVPFLILITFGKWIVLLNDKLNNEQ